MGNLITICDKESEFVEKLAEYLNERYRQKLEAMAFDNVEKLLSFEKKHASTISLVGEGILSAHQQKELMECTGYLAYLTKSRSASGIFKYQSAEKITKELIRLCLEKEIDGLADADQIISENKAQLIGFYSPVHDILQSSVALTMGQLLAAKKKVLYINFEPYSGFELLMQRQFAHDLMDVMFFLKEEDSKFRYRMESMTESIGQLDYLPPVFSYPDMEEIDPKLWQKLIQKLQRETQYEVILLDLTEQVRGLFSILEMCEKIYSCLPNDGLAMAKMQQYENLLSYIKKQEILDHTKRCRLPVFKDISYQAALYTHSQLADYVKEILADDE